jgi:GT2 family glycosyltransferase
VTAFRLLAVELTQPAPEVTLSAAEHGVGIVVRHCARFVGFVLRDMAPGTTVASEEILRLASVAAAEATVVNALREELLPGSESDHLPTVSLAICTRDRSEELVRCLESIEEMRAQSRYASLVRDVVVADNAPSDASTREVVARFSDVRYVLESKPGLDFARNSAWRAVTSDFVAYVDDDVVVDTHWLDGFARATRVNPDAAALTGLVLPLKLETEAQARFEIRGGFRRGFVPKRWLGAASVLDPLYPLGVGAFGAGCNMVIRREVLEALGGFDEALDTGSPLPGGGDLDIFYRVLRSGRALVYEPQMAVHHEHRRTTAQLTRQYYSWGLGFFAFLGKVWREEPARRRRVRAMVKWWTLYMLRLLRARRGRWDAIPLAMLTAELRGGLVGAFGEYARSERRVAAIRARHDRREASQESQA